MIREKGNFAEEEFCTLPPSPLQKMYTPRKTNSAPHGHVKKGYPHQKRRKNVRLRPLADYKIKDFKCDLCKYSASQKSNVNQHVQAIHYKIRKYECDQCEYSAKRKDDLRKHIEVVFTR